MTQNTANEETWDSFLLQWCLCKQLTWWCSAPGALWVTVGQEGVSAKVIDIDLFINSILWAWST